MAESEEIQLVEQHLHEAMSREVTVMRQVLGTMEQERQALLSRDEASALALEKYRITLVEEMRHWKEKMNASLEKLGAFFQQKHNLIEEDCAFIALKEQILFLGEKIALQNLQNRIVKGYSGSEHTQCQCFTSKPKLKVTTMEP